MVSSTVEDRMVERVSAFDWASTPLGSEDVWPQSLRTAVDICLHSRFPMFVWWGPACTNIYNDAYAPVLGERHPAALGRPARDVWRDAWTDVGPEVEAVFNRGESTWNDRRMLTLDCNGVPEDRYFTWSYSPVRDERGHVGGLFCVVTEETGRVCADARVADVLHSMTDGYFALDADWRLSYLNPQACTILGLAVDDVLGRTIWDIYPTLYETEFGAAYRMTAADRKPRSFTAYFEEQQRWYEVHAYPAAAGGISVYFRDVTANKLIGLEREQLLEAERAARSRAERAAMLKDEFLATLGHELRAPLNAILGWTSIIRDNDGDAADVAEGMEVIDRNGRLQARIIDDMLDMSMIVSGKLRMEMQPLDLAAIVRRAVEAIRPTAKAKRVRLLSEIDGGDDISIMGDPARLEQVLWNLLSNAIKFTPKGGRVQVTLVRAASHCEIVVTDTGEGIAADFLPFVFDRFRQADGSHSRRHGGLGLGLSIVKELVELHGGSVRATSAGLGQGASVTVEIPVMALAPAQAPAPEQRPARPAGPRLGARSSCVEIAGVRVLAVDDEPDARALIRRHLEEHQVVVTTTGSVDEAVRLVESGNFDVLVSDIGMPGEDGYSLIRRVRALGRDRGGDIPAIALTAYARVEDKVRAITAGFQMHVAKPARAVELVAMVAGAAGRTGC
jgi:PAS domain S-box-containing protein